MADNQRLAKRITEAAVAGRDVETNSVTALERDILSRLENGMSDEDAADWAADVVDILKAEECMEGEFV